MWQWNKPPKTNNVLAHYGIKGQKWGVITKEYEPVDNSISANSNTSSINIRRTTTLKSNTSQSKQINNPPQLKTRNPSDTTGRFGRGNIDLNKRKIVFNEDGSISTERSFSCNIDGKEVLLPTVIDGKIVSEDEAIDHYFETGQHLGRFDTVEEAEEYAEMLHNRQDWYYNTKTKNEVLNAIRIMKQQKRDKK